ncbi:MAG: STAS domain-containing protein [Actinomycetes bacterium]
MTVTGLRPTYVAVALDDETPPGEGARDLTAQLRQLFTEGASTVLVDMSRVRRLSSDIVAALLWARREARSRGGRVVLHAPNRRSASLLARSELGRLFEVDLAATAPSPWRHP